ncbi:TPA: hypothetical protein ACH3X1_007129 [Trebouxia sp. C0004]
MPSLHLWHVPDQVLPWPDIVEEACAFRESLPATAALYDSYVPAAQQPGGEEGTLMLLDNSLFPVVNQLDNITGLAAMKFIEFPEGFDLPEGVEVSQKQPTVFSVFWFVGRLAHQYAAALTPSFTRRQSLPLMLAF